jgi:hypothetical protein
MYTMNLFRDVARLMDGRLRPKERFMSRIVLAVVTIVALGAAILEPTTATAKGGKPPLGDSTAHVQCLSCANPTLRDRIAHVQCLSCVNPGAPHQVPTHH